MCVSETQEQTNSQTEVEEAGNRQEGGAMRSQESQERAVTAGGGGSSQKKGIRNGCLKVLNEGRSQRVPWMKLGNRNSPVLSSTWYPVCVSFTAASVGTKLGVIFWRCPQVHSVGLRLTQPKPTSSHCGTEPSSIGLPGSLFLSQRFSSRTSEAQLELGRQGHQVSVTDDR
jgi:hypothetical protein